MFYLYVRFFLRDNYNISKGECSAQRKLLLPYCTSREDYTVVIHLFAPNTKPFTVFHFTGRFHNFTINLLICKLHTTYHGRPLGRGGQGRAIAPPWTKNNMNLLFNKFYPDIT